MKISESRLRKIVGEELARLNEERHSDNTMVNANITLSVPLGLVLNPDKEVTSPEEEGRAIEDIQDILEDELRGWMIASLNEYESDHSAAMKGKSGLSALRRAQAVEELTQNALGLINVTVRRTT